MNVGILFTVRISSSRLPGKALLEVRGIPMIVYLIKRFKAMCSEKLIICTTDLPEDSCFDIIAEQLEIGIFHGNANNILHRGNNGDRVTIIYRRQLNPNELWYFVEYQPGKLGWVRSDLLIIK